MEPIPDKNTKPWQHGIPKYVIDEIKAVYDRGYNSYALSTFNEMNGPSIANAIHDACLFQHPNKEAFAIIKKVQRKTKIYSLDNLIGYYEPGDILYRAIAWTTSDGSKAIQDSLQANSVYHRFAEIWEENDEVSEMLWRSNFRKICTKVRSTGELIGVYYKEGDKMPVRAFTPMPTIDTLAIKIFWNHPELEKTACDFSKKLSRINEWKDHYSNYNYRKSWSALSLRGFLDDPLFIEKPSEVRDNSKFKELQGDFKLQNTSLFSAFQPELSHVLKIFPANTEFERIRFMRLKPGSLGRHTDIVDPDTGTQDGKTIRWHVPIVTNKEVTFHVWDYDGDEKKLNLPVGCLTYLDTRYPHSVTNTSKQERIHLVIDTFATPEIRAFASRR